MQHCAARDDVETVIVSSEDLMRSLEAIPKLSALLTPLFAEIRIICFLKRQDIFAISRYVQHVKGGATNSPIPLNLDDPALALYDYNNTLAQWRDGFTKAAFTIVPVGLATVNAKEDSVELFYKICGIDAADFASVSRSNSSPSPLALLAMEIVNSCKEELAAIDTKKILEQLPRDGSLYRLVSRKTALDFYTAFKPSNDLLAKTMNGGKRLFGDSFAMYPLNSHKERLLYRLGKEFLLLAADNH
jgi:hypothetical protein